MESKTKKPILPTDPKLRKDCPITTGVLDYFPRAIAYVAQVSKAGNDQHNPGQPLHWAKEKSNDHADCIPRHLIDRGMLDTDGIRHSGKLAWRALANLEMELEKEETKQAPKLLGYRRAFSSRINYRVENDVVVFIDSHERVSGSDCFPSVQHLNVAVQAGHLVPVYETPL